MGEDFYLTHATYRYAPGLVVWHSRDLVNWVPISSALSRTYGEIWAPDFVEHQGRYFIYFPKDGGLTVVHVSDPRGPWSGPIDLKVGGIDPGHVAGPDGTRYLHFAGGKAVQLSPDGLSVAGQPKRVYLGWQFVYHGYRNGFQTLGRHLMLEPVESTADGWPLAPRGPSGTCRCSPRWASRSAR